MSTQLYAVHIEGPDDIHAAPSKEQADTWAAQINELVKRQTEANPSEHWPRTVAKVIPWTGTPEEHAVEVLKWDER